MGVATLSHFNFSEVMGGDFGRRSFYADYWVGTNGLDQLWTLATGGQTEIVMRAEMGPPDWNSGEKISRQLCQIMCQEADVNHLIKGCLHLGENQQGHQILCSALKRKSFGYYHYRPQLTPLLMAMCLSIYLFFAAWRKLTNRLWPLWIVGRRSLGVYVLHLALVALTTLLYGSPKPFKSGVELHLCFGLILIACYCYAFWKERNRIFSSSSQIKPI